MPWIIQIKYPNGDVPAGKGVCKDVIIRTYRKVGIDLQKEVHEDIASNFDKILIKTLITEEIVYNRIRS